MNKCTSNDRSEIEAIILFLFLAGTFYERKFQCTTFQIPMQCGSTTEGCRRGSQVARLNQNQARSDGELGKTSPPRVPFRQAAPINHAGSRIPDLAPSDFEASSLIAVRTSQSFHTLRSTMNTFLVYNIHSHVTIHMALFYVSF